MAVVTRFYAFDIFRHFDSVVYDQPPRWLIRYFNVEYPNICIILHFHFKKPLLFVGETPLQYIYRDTRLPTEHSEFVKSLDNCRPYLKFILFLSLCDLITQSSGKKSSKQVNLYHLYPYTPLRLL